MSDTGFTAKQAGAECALGNLGKLGSIGVACVVSSKPSGDGGTQPRAKAWNTQAVPWHGRGSCNGARCQPARMASSATVAWCARPPAARPKASCRNMGRKLLGKAAMGKAGGTRDAIGKVDLMAAAAPKIPDAVFPRCLRSPCATAQRDPSVNGLAVLEGRRVSRCHHLLTTRRPGAHWLCWAARTRLSSLLRAGHGRTLLTAFCRSLPTRMRPRGCRNAMRADAPVASSGVAAGVAFLGDAPRMGFGAVVILWDRACSSPSRPVERRPVGAFHSACP